ncbi:MAG TPA: hypothetical protein VK550_11145 [Polyangiaceae bacterium]|nr:hypothetical protein [Polyangiaceae bacterium]
MPRPSGLAGQAARDALALEAIVRETRARRQAFGDRCDCPLLDISVSALKLGASLFKLVVVLQDVEACSSAPIEEHLTRARNRVGQLLLDLQANLTEPDRAELFESTEWIDLRQITRRRNARQGVLPRSEWSEGQRLLRGALRMGMNARELARRVGCSPSLVSLLASGNRGAPSSYRLREGFARELGIACGLWDEPAKFTNVNGPHAI